MDEKDDAAAWEGWDVETDSSDSDSDSEPWINVQSDGDENLDISDSEDEEDKKKAKVKVNTKEDVEDVPMEDAEAAASAATRISTLAQTKVRRVHRAYTPANPLRQILTPADFALLNELRIEAATKAVEAGGGSKTKRKLAALEADKKARTQAGNAEDVYISEADILGPRKKAKATYEERMASIEKGREGREKFGSKKGKQNKAAPSSSTNKEKARNKPVMMILSSGAVRGKKKASLREKQQKLRAHINKAKKAYH
jgi:protein SDA1